MQSLSRRGPNAARTMPDAPQTPLHATAVAVLEPRASAGGFSFPQLVCAVGCRLAADPELRRALEIDPELHEAGAPAFDPTARVLPVTPTEAVSERALCSLVGELSGRPMGAGSPRWRLYVIEGLFGGLVAAVLVMDAALADPGACVETLSTLLGLAPAEADSEASEEATELPQPGPAIQDDDLAFESGPAAQRWSGPLSDARITAYARSHRAAVDVVRRAFGGSREHVALAACTRALRRYLQAHGEPVDQPLVAALPAAGDASAREGELVRFVALPVHVSDPVDQLRFLQSETYRAQVAPRIVGRRWLGRPCEVASPEPVSSRGARRWDERPLRHDLVFRSLAGPDHTLYSGSTRVVALHPHGPLLPGAGLDLSVIRYGESIDFGLLAGADRVPDAVEIATGIEAAVADLVKRSFEERDGSLELADWETGVA